MNKMFQRGTALLSAAALAAGLAACGSSASSPAAASTTVAEPQSTAAASEPAAETSQPPKYIFLFIGDGMSYPQVQSTNYYLSALENGTSMGGDGAILEHEDSLSFVNFPVAGSAQTYDSTSFCPDSASTATSISTGHKTYSGTINMDETGTVSYETIAEKLKQQKDYKIGIVSSVNLNHATPAAFYCHQASRSSYYEIGQELIASDFDYFAGGALLKPTGADKDKTSLYDLAEEAGYTVVKTQAEAGAVTAETGKCILIDEHLADGDAMAYELDRADDEWSLADYVEKGIECLDNDTGFFMMVEGGKIDWACHANDAATTMTDTKALSDAVEKALAFYDEHPDETLILVTGDHETGGLTIGFAGTDYDTYLDTLANQTISYAQFDEQYVKGYKENGTSFEDAMKDVETLFGLKLTGEETDRLVLTEYEVQRLRTAYDLAMSDYDAKEFSQEQYVLYGTYNPFSVTVTHILNNKAGVDFTSYSHTGLPVAVFADGIGAEDFGGYYDNTEIYNKLANLLEVR